jgi:hypothetical protein
MLRSRLGTVALAAVVSLPVGLSAQAPAAGRNSWELLLSSGALVPTGAQRDAIKAAQLSTAQLSYVVRSRVAVTAMFGWARSRDLTTIDHPKLDVFTFDVGAEARAPQLAVGQSASFTPFAGLGAGSRSYNHRSLDVDATHDIAGYAAAGGELAKGRVHVRAEVRDYVSGFKPLIGAGTSATRNDVVALIGLRLTRRGS